MQELKDDDVEQNFIDFESFYWRYSIEREIRRLKVCIPDLQAVNTLTRFLSPSPNQEQGPAYARNPTIPMTPPP